MLRPSRFLFQGGRSNFSFGPRPAAATVPRGPPAPVANTVGGARRKNPKKDRAGRRQQKEDKKLGGGKGG